MPGARGRSFSQLWAGVKAVIQASLAAINNDDRVGSPKVLSLTAKRKSLTFSSGGQGRYEYKFSIRGL